MENSIKNNNIFLASYENSIRNNNIFLASLENCIKTIIFSWLLWKIAKKILIFSWLLSMMQMQYDQPRVLKINIFQEPTTFEPSLIASF